MAVSAVSWNERPPEGRGDVKSLVVGALSREWPLTLKELHSRVSHAFKPVTYQAVHKAVGELLSAGALSKNGHDYSLDADWVASQGEWWKGVRSSYSASLPKLSRIPENSSVSHVFPGVISVPYWMIEEFPPLLSGSDVVVEHWSFGWPAQMVSEEQHAKMRKFAECKGKCVLCRGKTPFDVHCLQFVQHSIGVRWVAGVSVATDCDVAAFKDFVVQIYWPKAVHRAFEHARRSPSLAAGMKLAYDFVFAGEGATLPIPVVITRNPALASKIIGDSLKLFERFSRKPGAFSSVEPVSIISRQGVEA